MHRVSLRAMMWYVSFIAVGLAALRNANYIWAGLISLLTLGTLGVSVLGVILRQGRERVWWIGFALFGGGYLVLAFLPWFSEIKAILGTTYLVDYLHLRSKVVAELENDYVNTVRRLDRVMLDAKTNPTNPSLPPIQRSLQRQRELLLQFGSPLATVTSLSTTQLPELESRIAQNRLMDTKGYYDLFGRIGHCLSALIAGLIGAVISSRMYREPEPAAS